MDSLAPAGQKEVTLGPRFRSENGENRACVTKSYIVYLGRKVGLFRPSVEFAVRVGGELARAEGECVLRTEDEYLK